ncbi:MAG TPA: 16S rRNA (guanine(527)-N(7))-methyltransferase RsmG [Bacteroidales bacterium]|nr:16S rRNA (guanine(527)-N(7))-methyltransferase RsmG [Bacteroidales bacterium]HOK74830.1 16S rRNA (guanine(527)-N(7))-methyltransferase RsmG [Bacteroidales bacterium]HOU31667.1 16S rRNA (guanine(527)-N(7))-methyltransferase RsmG [Bacteroidales bacterium]HPP93676.1 16S rRNA (guanine(527)-N(7))-methyltransferase RsmG [Bacteroidales bacterium]HQG56777.1 16S rRNA (guanine(527)-N(7))-methyltransferase RsmG [Bacteroidales bacterium]
MIRDTLTKYFPSLSGVQLEKLCRLEGLYSEWNSKINVISRRDIENFNIHHLLHSLSIARVISFVPGTEILDIGTGGGLPGIPLAIMFPEVHFVLLDSIRKKIKVVTEIAAALQLTNVKPVWERAENHRGSYDFIVSRAVADFPELVRIAEGKIKKESRNELKNGIIGSVQNFV